MANGHWGEMSTRANGHWIIGANEHFGQMGRVWDKRACEDWDKWAFEEMGILGQMGTLEPMSFEASEHLGQMGTWGEIATRKMSTSANGHLGQIGIWDKWALRACGDWDKWTFA